MRRKSEPPDVRKGRPAAQRSELSAPIAGVISVERLKVRCKKETPAVRKVARRRGTVSTGRKALADAVSASDPVS